MTQRVGGKAGIRKWKQERQMELPHKERGVVKPNSTIGKTANLLPREDKKIRKKKGPKHTGFTAKRDFKYGVTWGGNKPVGGKTGILANRVGRLRSGIEISVSWCLHPGFRGVDTLVSKPERAERT